MIDDTRRPAGRRPRIASGLMFLVLLASPGASFARERTSDQGSAPILGETTADWPEHSRILVGALVEKYGIPNRLNAVQAIWYDNGPWLKTVVHRDSWSSFWGIRDESILEQSIEYRVPHDKIAILRRFGKKIQFDDARGELSAKSENEGLNYLALNLADEIIAGKRSVKDALAFYRATQDLAKAGKSSPYLEGFMFAREDRGGD